MDALAVGLSGLLGLTLLYLVYLSHQMRSFKRVAPPLGPGGSTVVAPQLEQLTQRLDRAIDLFSVKPSLQGRLGEEAVELGLSHLPRRYWQRQPTLTNGNRPDYLLSLAPDLYVAVDAKMVAAEPQVRGELLEPRVLETRVRALADQVSLRYLEPGNHIALVLLVIPAGIHALLSAATLQACHARGVIPTPAEGVTAMTLLLVQLQPWLSQSSEKELAQSLSATRRALAASLELLERSSRQQRNGQENLERARQLMEGARTRLEASHTSRVVGGRTPALEEVLES